MGKAFFEVFPSLKLDTGLQDLFAQVTVDKVTSTKRKDFLRVYIVSDRLIQKEDVFRVEKEIKKDLPSRLHARRQMLKVLYPVKEVPEKGAGKKRNTKDVNLVDKLFDEYGPKYANRKGGYTRIIKIGPRKGDAAMEVVLELV